MELLKYLSQKDRRHFMKCECGAYFDMRNLNEVSRHLHRSFGKNASPSSSRPSRFTEKGNR